MTVVNPAGLEHASKLEPSTVPAMKTKYITRTQIAILALQGMSDDITTAHRQELETAISQKADVVAHNQKERRHELDSRMHKLVCEHEEGLIEEASGYRVNYGAIVCPLPERSEWWVLDANKQIQHVRETSAVS